MPSPITITDLSAGELSPRMRGRVDAPIYNKGLETSYNYTSIPFGGVTRRPGAWFIDDITAAYAPVSPPMMIDYPSDIHDDEVLVVFQDASNNIKLIPIIFGSTITVGTTRTLANPYPGVVGASSKWARREGEGAVYCASLQVAPFTLTNTGTNDAWTIAFSTYSLPAWNEGEYYNFRDLVTGFSAVDVSSEQEANVGKVTSNATYWAAYTGPTQPDFMINATGTDAEKSLWYPCCVTTWMGRVIYAGSVHEPMSMWGSGIRQYEYFNLGINSNSPWKHSLTSYGSGRIQWMVAGDVLAVGTASTEIIITGNQFGITPTNIQVQTKTAHGSSDIQPVLYNEQIMFMKPDKQQIFGMSYMDVLGRYYAQHLSQAADHINKLKIASWTLVRNPRTSLLIVLEDGHLVQMIYDRAQQQIAFYPWYLGGSREVVGIGSLTSNGDEDRVTLVVKDGSSYSIEVLHWTDFANHTSTPTGSSNAYTYGMYLDGATEIAIQEDATGFYATGLDDWDGIELSVVVDNAPHPMRTPVAGRIELDHDGAFGYVGHNYESYGQTMNIPPSMLVKRINQFGVRFVDTVGGSIGPTYEDMEEIIFRDGDSYYDTTLGLYTGDHIIDNVGGFDRDQYIWFGQNVATPQTIVQIVAWTERYE